MRPGFSAIQKVELDAGTISAPMFGPGSRHIVGDRYVPSPIHVDFPGADGQPALWMVIEVIDGVPRCTELTLRRVEGGREIRQKDLKLIEIDSWVEIVVAKMSMEIVSKEGEKVHAVVRGDEESVRRAMKTIQDSRKGSRRPLTEARKQRIAEVYNAQETGGLEAIQRAFNVSRSTAARYKRAALEAGLIEEAKK